jgi:hypothetical protein
METAIAIEELQECEIVALFTQTGLVSLFKSMRDAATQLRISHSTISKKLKGTHITCVKSDGYDVVIRRLYNNQMVDA